MRIITTIWLVVIITLLSCNEQTTPVVINRELTKESDRFDLTYKIYTLEGCEYIVVSPGNGHFTWGSHKGNCKNPIHLSK